MTFEVELKFRLSDPAALQRRLSELGARSEPPRSQSDCYLSHPCRDFAATNEALRIRTVGDQSFVTYKGPELDAAVKTRREIELRLGDEPDRFLELFAKLGFQPVLTVTKTRRPFYLDWHGNRIELALDEVPPVGTFLEIELLAEEADVASAQHAVRQLAAALGLDAAEKKTYLELMLEAAKIETPAKKSRG